MPLVKNVNGALTGLFLIAVAIVGLILSWPLSSITDIGLGPGYVPKALSILQIIIGVALIVDGCIEPGEAVEAWQFRPVVLILGSIAFFAATIEAMGLVVAVGGLVLISCAANRETKFRDSLLLAIGSAVASVLIFVKALGLPIMVWPRFLGWA